MKKNFATLIALVMLLTLFASTGAVAADGAGGLITIAMPALGATIDPVDNTDGMSAIFIYATYDRLIKFAVNGDMADDKSYDPSIAKEWTLSDDGLTWTFYLDENAVFANGDPVTAEDVAFSFDRCATRENGEFVYSLTRIEETNIIDDHTIEFKLSQLCPTFMQLIEMYPFAICNKAQVEGQPDNWLASNAAGSGPYTITSYDTSTEVVLEARDDYWGERAKNDKIIAQLIAEPSNRKMMLEKGDVDFTIELTPADLDGLTDVADVEVLSKPSNTILYFAMNCDMAPFDDVRVRQAINYAIPYEDLVESVMGDRATRMTSIVPTIMAEHVEVDGKTYYNQDLGKAKALLEEAGLGDGFEFEFVLGSGFQDWADDAVLIQAELAKIGVTMNIKNMDRAQFLDLMRQRDKVQACITRFLSYVNDPGYTTGMLLVTGADFNYNNYSNEEFDAQHALAESTTDPAERVAALEQLQYIAAADAPFAYLYEYNNTVAQRADIDGFVFYPDRTIRFEYLFRE